MGSHIPSTRDVNHCVSKALVDNCRPETLFVLEDLKDIRKVSERVLKKNRYVQVSWAFHDLAQKITYKAEKSRSLAVKVDPAYTSQRCPRCGHTAKANRNKKTHTFKCRACGYTSNDDRVGAMNLQRIGKDLIAGQEVPLAERREHAS